MAPTAAQKKALAQAAALQAKLEAQLAAAKKQEASAAAFLAEDKAAKTAQKLADQKAAREADLAAKSAARKETLAASKVDPSTLAVKGGQIFQMLGGILYFNGTPFNGNDSGKKYVNGIVTGAATDETTGDTTAVVDTPGLAVDTFRKTLALYFGEAESKKPWVDALYKTASGFYKTGSTAEESMNLALAASRNDPVMKPFTDRFSAIYKLQDLKTSGVSVEVPTIGEFVKSQGALGDIFRRSNLADLATDAYTSELLGKGLSVTTIAENIANVFDVIDQAPKEVKDTINRYYPTADRGKLAKALLTGTKGVAELEKEVKGYQVLAAAETQGIGANTLTGGITAEQASNYAAGGQTFQSSLVGFSQVAQARETEEKLATLSGRKSMGVAGLADAIIGKKATAITDFERLSAEEENRYKGKTRGILSSQTRGMI
jgi:hypothetical protein